MEQEPYRRRTPNPEEPMLLPAAGPAAPLRRSPQGPAGQAVSHHSPCPVAGKGSESADMSFGHEADTVISGPRGRRPAGHRGCAGVPVPVSVWCRGRTGEQAGCRAPRGAVSGAALGEGLVYWTRSPRLPAPPARGLPPGGRLSGLCVCLCLPCPLQVWGRPCREPPVRVLRLPGGDRGAGQAQAD